MILQIHLYIEDKWIVRGFFLLLLLTNSEVVYQIFSSPRVWEGENSVTYNQSVRLAELEMWIPFLTKKDKSLKSNSCSACANGKFLTGSYETKLLCLVFSQNTQCQFISFVRIFYQNLFWTRYHLTLDLFFFHPAILQYLLHLIFLRIAFDCWHWLLFK